VCIKALRRIGTRRGRGDGKRLPLRLSWTLCSANEHSMPSMPSFVPVVCVCFLPFACTRESVKKHGMPRIRSKHCLKLSSSNVWAILVKCVSYPRQMWELSSSNVYTYLKPLVTLILTCHLRTPTGRLLRSTACLTSERKHAVYCIILCAFVCIMRTPGSLPRSTTCLA
jgi:hypothetical protein